MTRGSFVWHLSQWGLNTQPRESHNERSYVYVNCIDRYIARICVVFNLIFNKFCNIEQTQNLLWSRTFSPSLLHLSNTGLINISMHIILYMYLQVIGHVTSTQNTNTHIYIHVPMNIYYIIQILHDNVIWHVSTCVHAVHFKNYVYVWCFIMFTTKGPTLLSIRVNFNLTMNK